MIHHQLLLFFRVGRISLVIATMFLLVGRWLFELGKAERIRHKWLLLALVPHVILWVVVLQLGRHDIRRHGHLLTLRRQLVIVRVRQVGGQIGRTHVSIHRSQWRRLLMLLLWHRSFVKGDCYCVGVWTTMFLVVIFTFVEHRSDRCRFKALNRSLSFLPRRVSLGSSNSLVFLPRVWRFWKFEHLTTVKVHDSYIADWWLILWDVIVFPDALFWRRHILTRVVSKPIFVAKEPLYTTTIVFGLFGFHLARGRERRGRLRCDICLSLSWYVACQESWGQGDATFPRELFDAVCGHCSLSRSYLLSVVRLSVTKTAWGSWR